eukprot:m.186559 g.186559  ORF g.186559 m.186559 type:complete len:418 (-) comp53564_c0_seq1:1131-2384(-)
MLLEIQRVAQQQVLLTRHRLVVVVEGPPHHVVGAPKVVPQHAGHAVVEVGGGVGGNWVCGLHTERNDGRIHNADEQIAVALADSNARVDGVHVLIAANDNILGRDPFAQFVHLPGARRGCSNRSECQEHRFRHARGCLVPDHHIVVNRKVLRIGGNDQLHPQLLRGSIELGGIIRELVLNVKLSLIGLLEHPQAGRGGVEHLGRGLRAIRLSKIVEGPRWRRLGCQVVLQEIKHICLTVHAVHKLAEQVFWRGPNDAIDREMGDSASVPVETDRKGTDSEGLIKVGDLREALGLRRRLSSHQLTELVHNQLIKRVACCLQSLDGNFDTPSALLPPTLLHEAVLRTIRSRRAGGLKVSVAVVRVVEQVALHITAPSVLARLEHQARGIQIHIVLLASLRDVSIPGAIESAHLRAFGGV